MKKANLFSVAGTDLAQVREALETALSLDFEAHQSDYRGGDYFRMECNGVSFILQENFVEDDGEPTEAEFPHAALLLYADGDESDVDGVSAVLAQQDCIEKLLKSSVY